MPHIVLIYVVNWYFHLAFLDVRKNMWVCVHLYWFLKYFASF